LGPVVWVLTCDVLLFVHKDPPPPVAAFFITAYSSPVNNPTTEKLRRTIGRSKNTPVLGRTIQCGVGEENGSSKSTSKWSKAFPARVTNHSAGFGSSFPLPERELRLSLALRRQFGNFLDVVPFGKLHFPFHVRIHIINVTKSKVNKSLYNNQCLQLLFGVVTAVLSDWVVF